MACCMAVTDDLPEPRGIPHVQWKRLLASQQRSMGAPRDPESVHVAAPKGGGSRRADVAAGCSAPAAWVDGAADQVQQEQRAEEEDERECLERAAHGRPRGWGEGVEGRGGEE